MTHEPDRPTVEDVNALVGELLPAFDEDYLRRSFPLQPMNLVLGAMRSQQMFPRSSRLQSKALVNWEARTKVTLLRSDAFDVIFDPEFASLMPYAVLSVELFGRPLRSVILEMQRRLHLEEDGFALLWIGGGGHVTPLHHDGPLIGGRRHLVVRGHKQFDLLPPRFAGVSRLPRWDLYRRFSSLYKTPLPDDWFAERAAGARFQLTPGQMLTWPRQWWHRVEIDRTGVTIALSTRGLRARGKHTLRTVTDRLEMRLLGDVENIVERRSPVPEVLTVDDVVAMRDAAR